MSADPRQIVLSYARGVADAVVEELRGEPLEAVFLAGSAARGEVAAFTGVTAVEIYSDVDVFAIVRDARDLDALRRRARRAAGGVPREGDGYRILPEPDVGVYSIADFLGQKARPGTVEIAGSHIVLYGDPEIPSLARRFDAAGIDASEALYLIENRVAELADLGDRLEAERSGAFRRYCRYVRWKSGLDAVSAILIALGRFHPSRPERTRRFRECAGAGLAARFVPERGLETIERCERALAGLAVALEEESDEGPFATAVEVLLSSVWQEVAASSSGLDKTDWIGLVEWRCKKGRWVTNARELWVLARRAGRSRVRVLGAAGRLARFSAGDLVRVSGIVELLVRGESRSGEASRLEESGGYVSVLDGLTRAFGYGEGSVFRRARRMLEEMA